MVSNLSCAAVPSDARRLVERDAIEFPNTGAGQKGRLLTGEHGWISATCRAGVRTR
jgi:hypothetical protein